MGADEGSKKSPLERICGAKSVEMADGAGCEALEPYVDRVLDVLGHPEAMVSDESRVSDFLDWTAWATEAWGPRGRISLQPDPAAKARNDERLRKMAEALRIPVGERDYIVDVARKLKVLGTA